MPSFSCDRCSDVVKKPKVRMSHSPRLNKVMQHPKLDAHSFRCKASVTCLDCSTTFPDSNAWKSHTSCISEAQKYEKTKSDSNDDFNGEKSVNKTEDNGGLGSELKTAEKRQKENMNKSKDSDNLVSTDAKKENTELRSENNNASNQHGDHSSHQKKGKKEKNRVNKGDDNISSHQSKNKNGDLVSESRLKQASGPHQTSHSETEVEKAENGVKKKKKKKEKKKEGDTPKETKVDSQSLLETLKLLKSKLLAETISVSKDDQFADLKSEKKLDGCTNLNQGLDTKKDVKLKLKTEKDKKNCDENSDPKKTDSESKPQKKRKKEMKSLDQEDDELHWQGKKLKSDKIPERDLEQILTAKGMSQVKSEDNKTENESLELHDELGGRKLENDQGKQKKNSKSKLKNKDPVESDAVSRESKLKKDQPCASDSKNPKFFGGTLVLKDLVSIAVRELVRASDKPTLSILELIDGVCQKLRPYEKELEIKRKSIINLIINDTSIKVCI
ncbi:hypothetical protein BY996DRAFT_6413242 [Phakopsora pachyrhizi]|nr:hypothetical protein BY996DRAFT_6413242 [Phakopsora pachyrhizi]